MEYNPDNIGNGSIGPDLPIDHALSWTDTIINIISPFRECYGSVINYIDNDCFRTASDDLRQIANQTISIKIQIRDRIVQTISINYGNIDNRYIDIPFEIKENPEAVQQIIDRWFKIDGNTIVAKRDLFIAISEYYKESRKVKSTEWFSQNTEWIKFKYINGIFTPCEFKRIHLDN